MVQQPKKTVHCHQIENEAEGTYVLESDKLDTNGIISNTRRLDGKKNRAGELYRRGKAAMDLHKSDPEKYTTYGTLRGLICKYIFPRNYKIFSKRGKRCERTSTVKSQLCWHHDPESSTSQSKKMRNGKRKIRQKHPCEKLCGRWARKGYRFCTGCLNVWHRDESKQAISKKATKVAKERKEKRSKEIKDYLMGTYDEVFKDSPTLLEKFKQVKEDPNLIDLRDETAIAKTMLAKLLELLAKADKKGSLTPKHTILAIDVIKDVVAVTEKTAGLEEKTKQRISSQQLLAFMIALKHGMERVLITHGVSRVIPEVMGMMGSLPWPGAVSDKELAGHLSDIDEFEVSFRPLVAEVNESGQSGNVMPSTSLVSSNDLANNTDIVDNLVKMQDELVADRQEAIELACADEQAAGALSETTADKEYRKELEVLTVSLKDKVVNLQTEIDELDESIEDIDLTDDERKKIKLKQFEKVVNDSIKPIPMNQVKVNISK